MKLHLFIEEDEGSVILDRSFFIVEGNAPVINLQDIVDDAVKYKEDEIKTEAERLINQDKAQE